MGPYWQTSAVYGWPIWAGSVGEMGDNGDAETIGVMGAIELDPFDPRYPCCGDPLNVLCEPLNADEFALTGLIVEDVNGVSVEDVKFGLTGSSSVNQTRIISNVYT